MNSEPAPIRIMILGGEALFRDALAGSLGSCPDFQIVGCPSSQFDEALTLIYAGRVDVVLLTLNPGDKRCIELAGRAREQGFEGELLAITGGTSSTEDLHALERCRAGIFLKTQSMNMLHLRIREVSKKRVSPEHGSPDVSCGQIGQSVKRTITSREAAVLLCISEGLSNREIASCLGISENTVKTFVQHLFQKTGAQSRSQLVRNAIEHWAEQARKSPGSGSRDESQLSAYNRRRNDPINLLMRQGTPLSSSSD
jgi:DNA-binding NarL/FixJ family response regulator